MTVRLIHGDVLDATTEGLILTIDGTQKGLEGNLARAYARRWPDSFEELGYEIPYPLPLGRAVAVRIEDDSPFRVIVLASTLHHLDVLDERQKVAVTTSAYSEAIALARRFRLRSIASAVLSGGWRLPVKAALHAMLTVARPFSEQESALSVEIHFKEKQDLNDAVAHANSIAFPLRPE